MRIDEEERYLSKEHMVEAGHISQLLKRDVDSDIESFPPRERRGKLVLEAIKDLITRKKDSKIIKLILADIYNRDF